jgi:hypothetical protein
MQKFNLGSSFGKRHQLTKDAAESMAIEALGFLAEDPARLDRFWLFPALGSIICGRQRKNLAS